MLCGLGQPWPKKDLVLVSNSPRSYNVDQCRVAGLHFCFARVSQLQPTDFYV